MSGSVNKVILIGNLGRDPEVRTMPSGDKIVTFSLATTESWRDKATGERKDKTEWHNVAIFNENLGRVAEQYCKKGAKIYIEGQLQTREYTDRDGNQRKATEVVLQRFRGELTLLDSRGGGRSAGADDGGYDAVPDRGGGGGGGGFGRSSPRDGGGGGRGDRRPATVGGGSSGGLDDDIPF